MAAGYAVGGGHVLHMVCDLTIAADNAIFGQTGPKVGSFDAGYGSSIMSRLVGLKKAREMWFLARFYNAQEAEKMGLINTVVPKKMKQLSDNLPEGSIDKPGPDDIFSKVMGKDRNGDAVMYGLGVRASDVWGVIPSRSACRRENNELKSRCEELTSTVEQLRAQVSEMKGSRDSSSVPPLTLPRSPVVTDEPPRLRVGDEVLLKSILNSTETVAKGWVKSLDPNDLVGGIEIGRGWCEVNVQVPTKRDEMLVRPYGLFATIEDCVGATIA